MLSLDVPIDWGTASWSITLYAPGAMTALFAADSARLSAWDWVRDFVAWANAAGRPWFGVVTWESDWQRTSDGGMAIVLRYSPASVTAFWFGYPKLSLPSYTSLTTVGNKKQLVATAAAPGTWYPRGGLSLPGLSGDLDAGAAGPAFGARPGAPGLAVRNGRAEAAGLLVDASRLTGLLTSVQQPIRGRVFSAVDQTWHYVLLGEVSRSTRNPGLYGWTLEVWQEP